MPETHPHQQPHTSPSPLCRHPSPTAQAVNFVHTLLSRGYAPREVATALVDECLAAEQTVTPVSMDNVTVLLVLLEGMPEEARKQQQEGDGAHQQQTLQG